MIIDGTDICWEGLIRGEEGIPTTVTTMSPDFNDPKKCDVWEVAFCQKTGELLHTSLLAKSTDPETAQELVGVRESFGIPTQKFPGPVAF